MKVGRKPPEERTLLVKTGQSKSGDEHRYDLYLIRPEVIAQLVWDGKLSWSAGDGMRFQGAQSAIDYVMKEMERRGRTLTSGRYFFEYDEVLEQGDRLVLKSKKTGATIVIHSGKEL